MKRIAVVICIALLATTIAHADKKHQGKPLGEWMKHYWTWFFNGEPSSGSIGRTVFLPIPPGEELEEGSNIFVGETSFQLQPGESFVLPMFVWIGERYLRNLNWTTTILHCLRVNSLRISVCG